MTSRRSYRNEMDIDYAKQELENCSGTQFDPKIANAFLDILNNESYKLK